MIKRAAFFCRTEFTFGQTYAPIREVVEALRAQGCTHAGICDEDNTFGHGEWAGACEKAGIVPLFGVDLLIEGLVGMPFRVQIVALDAVGLGEVYRLASVASSYTLSDKGRALPCVPAREAFELKGELLIACAAMIDPGHVQAVLSDVHPRLGVSTMQDWAIPMQRWHAAPIFAPVNNCARIEHAPLLAYADALQSVEPLPVRCAPVPDFVSLDDLPKLPKAPMMRHGGDLAEAVEEGVELRFPDGLPDGYRERITEELDTINAKGFSDYFLIVADMVRWAKDRMLVGPSRGSAAGSLVCYLLGITELDPIPANLLFFRFLDPARSDWPDIDLDFPDSERDSVFDYMRHRWGHKHTARLGAILYHRVLSAIDAAARRQAKLHGTEVYAAADKLKDAAKLFELEEANAKHQRVIGDLIRRDMEGAEENAGAPIAPPTLAAHAAMLEGMAKTRGQHAAGLLLAGGPIRSICAVDHEGVAHVDKWGAEAQDILKIDVLGLKTLTVLTMAARLAGIDPDFYSLTPDDPEVFRAVFNARRYRGIFQFEGFALQRFARQMHFMDIGHIDAATALARPGPIDSGMAQTYVDRMNGEPYDLHPALRPYLGDTFGVMLYQEQMMLILKDIGGFDWPKVNKARKAVGKSLGQAAMREFEEPFREAALKTLPVFVVDELWSQILAAGAYSFNRAHSRSYALISYWCAWMKTKHPASFYAACMQHAGKAKDRVGYGYVDLDRPAKLTLHEFLSTVRDAKYEPANAAKGGAQWSSVGRNRLIGSLCDYKGIGNKTAATIASGRAGPGTLEKLVPANNPLHNIYPIRTQFADFFGPDSARVEGGATMIEALREPIECDEAVIIGRVSRVAPGSDDKGEFVKFTIEDDTDEIHGKLHNKRAYTTHQAADFIADVSPGDLVMIRANFFYGKKYAHAIKYKVLQ